MYFRGIKDCGWWNTEDIDFHFKNQVENWGKYHLGSLLLDPLDPECSSKWSFERYNVGVLQPFSEDNYFSKLVEKIEKP